MPIHNPSSTPQETTGFIGRLGALAKRYRLLAGAALGLSATACGQAELAQYKGGTAFDVHYSDDQNRPELTICVRQFDPHSIPQREYSKCLTTQEPGVVSMGFDKSDVDAGLYADNNSFVDTEFSLDETAAADGWGVDGCDEAEISENTDKLQTTCRVDVRHNVTANDLEGIADDVSDVADGVNENADAISEVQDGVDQNADAIDEVQNDVNDLQDQVNETLDAVTVKANATVVDAETGNSIEGAVLTLVEPYDPEHPVEVMTQADGTTTITGLPADQPLTFEISASGYQTQTITISSSQGGDSHNVTVMMTPESMNGSLEWSAGGFVAQEGFTVSLTDPTTGEPLFPVKDSATGAPVTDAVFSSTNTDVAQVDPNGQEIRGVAPGCASIEVTSPTHPNRVSAPVRVEDADGNPDSCPQ